MIIKNMIANRRPKVGETLWGKPETFREFADPKEFLSEFRHPKVRETLRGQCQKPFGVSQTRKCLNIL